jgi:hypothetical protein
MNLELPAATGPSAGQRPVAPALKKPVPIDALLQWAYLDELPKRKTSSAEGIWDRLSQYGSLGGVNPDPGHGAAQRYPHFGLPHKDAEEIEKAVNKLADVAVDWSQDYDLLAGELAPLVSVNDMHAAALAHPAVPVATLRPAPDGRGVVSVVSRDVLLVNTIRTEALVYTHAIRATAPQGWRVKEMHAVPTPAERSPLAKIIGICKGKNSYSSGSCCPLKWSPSPIKIMLARANYLVWHRALVGLSAQLSLTEHLALPPEAPEAPWIDEGPVRWLIGPVVRRAVKPLPLAPARKQAGPPKRYPRDKGRRIEVGR